MLALYALLVAFAGFIGALIPVFVEDVRPPRYLFLIELPPTSLGLGLYGVLTVATALGIPLLLIVLISRTEETTGR